MESVPAAELAYFASILDLDRLVATLIALRANQYAFLEVWDVYNNRACDYSMVARWTWAWDFRDSVRGVNINVVQNLFVNTNLFGFFLYLLFLLFSETQILGLLLRPSKRRLLDVV